MSAALFAWVLEKPGQDDQTIGFLVKSMDDRNVGVMHMLMVSPREEEAASWRQTAEQYARSNGGAARLKCFRVDQTT